MKKEIVIPVFVTVAVFLIVAIPTYFITQEEKKEMLYEDTIPIDTEVARYCEPYQPSYCGSFTVTPSYVQAFTDKELQFAHDCMMGTEEDVI